MKKIVTENLSQNEDTKVLMSDMGEESHYVHTINDFVLLIEKHGWSQVIGDLREAMGNKAW